MIEHASFSMAGRKGDNQDNILVQQNNESYLLAIADGMGGKQAGCDASKIALESLSSSFQKNTDVTLSAMVRKAKDDICTYAEEHDISQMGTTLTVCVISQSKVSVAHIGDTRLYHLRGAGIISVTKDQTEVQKLIDDGILSKKRAAKYHRRNVLLSALSNFSDYSLFETEFYVNNGDRLILLTDGAYDLLKKVEIRDASINSADTNSLAESCKKIIESREIRDDYSLIACQINNDA